MTARAGLRLVIAAAAMVAATGAFSLFRHGYTPDEEFTLFAVRGITAYGLPLLPSGLLYDRGLLYSYAAWLAGWLTGAELPAFRGLGLASAAVTLPLGFTLIRRIASPAAGVVAALLVATSLPFWAVATTGRFYAPFLLACVAMLLTISQLSHLPAPARTRPHLPAPARTRPHPPAPARTLVAVLCLAFAARLLHELAFTAMALPLTGLALTWTDPTAPPAARRDWTRAAVAIAAGLMAAQGLLLALHFLMPPGDGAETMIRRFFVWQVLNLLEHPAGAPLGLALAGVLVAVLFAPRRAALVVRVGAIVSATVIAGAFAYARLTASPSPPLKHAFDYPLDMFWSLAAAHPVMVWTGLASIGARLAGAGGEWPVGERAAHLGWAGWVLWFGVIESGITINYQLLPTVCLLTAIGLDLVAIGGHIGAVRPGRLALMVRAALVGVALLAFADQWRGSGTLSERLAAARPTIDVPGIDVVRSTLQPGDQVACTDELACLLLVGRVDVWLALDPYLRERFVVARGMSRVGVYAGAPAAFSVAEAMGDGARRTIVVDVFKEYPVGNSSAWLPRALAAEHLTAQTLLDSRQARVVEIKR